MKSSTFGACACYDMTMHQLLTNEKLSNKIPCTFTRPSEREGADTASSNALDGFTDEGGRDFQNCPRRWAMRAGSTEAKRAGRGIEAQKRLQ
jgi:hypothetical protein